MLDRGEYYTPT
ncbi:276f8f97-b743-4648-bca1-7c6470f54aef [Thermothielavioides terrestris]|uniref:276f8f97-b743-4648-bca1-7c6470f54aef n=1 Tax=Thermothielavioides terrestris TaxID=2587410 RepID=A0A446BYF5_9PEZI|nr:276f8f97-b743-4648-bca1-7c6470f54aef [Thermothielavioides terrestris]